MNFSEFLQTVPMFADFTQAELGVLEQAMVVRQYPDGHVFIREGESGDAMYLIVDGQVNATRKRHPERGFDVLEKMGPGDMFGLVSLIDYGRRSSACTAVGPVSAASLPRSAFLLLYKAHAPIGYHFQYLIARQLARDARVLNQVLLDAVVSDYRPGIEDALDALPREITSAERDEKS